MFDKTSLDSLLEELRDNYELEFEWEFGFAWRRYMFKGFLRIVGTACWTL